MTAFATGYYAYIAANGREYATGVHVIRVGDGMVCGTKRKKRWEYQMVANRAALEYVTCRGCKEAMT